MVNYIKRSVLFFLAIVVGASTLITVFFPNQTNAISESYRFINNITVGAYTTVSADRGPVLTRTYVAKDPLVLWNVNNDENGGVYLEAPIKSSSNGSICSDRIFFKGTGNMARVTRTKSSGACQAAEKRTPITVNTENFKKFFTAQANGSLLSLKNVSMVRVPSDATIFVENNLSAKCPAMLRKNGSNVWGVIGAEPKAEGTVDFDSEGRTKSYQQYAAAALGEDKFGNCQIGGNDQKSYSKKAAAMLMGGTADKWGSATGGVYDYISIKPGNENHDGMPFGYNGGSGFSNWGSPVIEYKGTIEAPVTNCDVYLDKILRGHCQSGFENDAADFCTNSTNLSFAEAVPTVEDRFAACVVGQTIAANGSLDIPEKQDECLADDTTCTAGATTSCVVDGIGWIVCPLINAIGGVSDAIYKWIQDILLLNPLQMNEANGDPTTQYQAWQRIRDITNVLLVIAFLFIIFSQITSIGVTNYGIKKLLPRVILVAILVNVSFIIMMLAIDAVNLIGKSLYDVLTGLAPDVTGDSIDAENAIGSLTTGVLAGTIAGASGVIAGGLIGAPALALIAVPFIVVAFLSLFAAIATLFIRNALVIILVLIAPLAFAAFLLPNTKSFFDRWRKLLVGVLFLYPTAALLFGGTKFAAYTLANDEQPLSILIAVFVMAAPLGLLPWLAASSGGILGTIGGKLQGMARSAKAPLQKGLQSRVENQRERYKSGQNTLFGRRRSQAEFDKRQIDTATGARKRNWGERLNQARTSRDTDTANAKTAQQANVAERGLRGTSRRDRAMGDVQREGLRQADQKASQGAEYRAQVDRMVATPRTVDAQRDARKFDATQASEGYNATTKLRNEQRIINNAVSTAAGETTGLQDQATATFGTNEDIKAAEGEILTINQNSGVANDAIQQQKVNEQAQGQFTAERQEVFDESIVADPTLMQVALGTEQAKLGSVVAQGVVATKVAREKDTGGKMFKEEVRRQALEDKAKRSGEHTQQVIEEARTDKGSRIANLVGTENRDMLQQEKKRREEIKDATTSAQLVQRGEYADRLVNDPAVATVAGGIDPDGASRVRAGAVAQVRSERNKAIDNHIELYAHEQYDPVTLVDTIANGTLPDGSSATEEQVSAAVKYVMTKGTNEQQMQIYDILAGGEFHDSVPDPANPTKRIVSTTPSGRQVPAQVLQDLSTFSSTSKIQSVGGSFQNDLNTGNGIPSYNDLILNRVQGGKLTKEKFANMDIDEMTRYAQLAASGAFGAPGDPATQAHRDALRDAIQKAKADKNINRYFDKEKTDALDAVLGVI